MYFEIFCFDVYYFMVILLSKHKNTEPECGIQYCMRNRKKKRKEMELGEFGNKKYRGHCLLFLTKYNRR